jgi:uncharacterized protein (TIGR00369 family)
MAKESLPPMGFQLLVGLEVTAREDGLSRCRLEVGEQHLNPHGVVHGGVVYSLADTGMGAAVYSRLEPHESCATIELKMVYIAPVRSGVLECESRVVHRGRRVAVLESDVTNDGRLVAKALGTFAIFDEQPAGRGHGGQGTVVSLNVSQGGVPKLPITEGRVGRLGLEGDRQANPGVHGGPERALCLFSAEVIATLQAEGHPIGPGTTGENVTIAGIDWTRMVPGSRWRLGDTVEIEVTRPTTPCKTIRASFRDGDFNRIHDALHPGESRVYARVLREGTLRVGDRVEEIAPGEAS